MAVRIDQGRGGLSAPNSGGVQVRGPGQGNTVAALGVSLSNFADPQLRKMVQDREEDERQADLIEVAKAGSAARLDWQKRLQGELEAYDGAEPGFAERVTKSYAEDARARIAAAPERLRPAMELDLVQYGERMTSAAIEGEAGKRQAYTMGSLIKTLDTEAMTLLERPDDLPGAIESLDRLAEAAPASLRDKFKEDGRRVLTASYAEAMLRDDPAQFLSELTDGLLDQVLQPEHKANYLNQAQAGVDRIISAEQKRIETDLKARQQLAKDLTARVVAFESAGLPPPAELIAAAQDAALAIEDDASLERMKLAEYKRLRGGANARRNPATPDSFKAIDKALSLGLEPSAELLSEAVAAIEADPTGKLGPRLDEIVALQGIRQDAALMSREALDARIEELRTAPTGSAEVKVYELLTKVRAARVKQGATDNIGWAKANGVEIAPVDFAAGNLPGQMALRARDAKILARETGEPVQIFSAAERAELGKALEGMPPDQQAEVLGSMALGAGDMSGAAIRELAGKKPGFARAGYLIATNRGDTGLAALRGLNLLKSDKGLLPKSKASLETLEREVLGGVLPENQPQLRAGVIETARGLFALAAKEQGKTEGDFSAEDHDTYRAALQAAVGQSGDTGGIAKVGKSQVWLPRHMTGPEMKSLLENMTLDQWKTFSLTGGNRPMRSDGTPLSLDELKRARLVSVGEGRYQLKIIDPRLGDSYVLGAVSDTKQTPYVLDLTRVDPAAVQTTRRADGALAKAQAASDRRRDDTRRADGTKKERGFLGELKRPDGKIMTEYSVGVNIDGNEVEIPTLVPTLTKDEVNLILNLPEGQPPPEAIIRKAIKHAEQRMKENKSPFWNPRDDK